MRPEFAVGTRLSRRGRIPLASALTALTLLLVLSASPAQAGARLDRVERSVIKRVNALRGGMGLPSLRASRRLARACDLHSRDMLARNFFAHQSSNGQSFAQRIERFKRSKASGETLAFLDAHARRKARTIVAMWMASPGHRAELLDPRFRRIGVGRRRGPLWGRRVIVVTADLATRR